MKPFAPPRYMAACLLAAAMAMACVSMAATITHTGELQRIKLLCLETSQRSTARVHVIRR